jgi:hypothetical protein
MKFLPRVCDPSLFSRLPGTQFPVSMVHSVNDHLDELWLINPTAVKHDWQLY